MPDPAAVFRFIILFCLCAFFTSTSSLSSSPESSFDGCLDELMKEAEKPIVVVIPSYNNKEWYQRNLDSVLSQNYHNFRVIYIDDASPDGTGKLVEDYIKKYHCEHRVTLIRNPKRLGALANVYKGIWLCAPNEIVANLDGDDWLQDENVFAKLNDVYTDLDVWVTYGQFIFYPQGRRGWAAEVPKEVIENNTFRYNNWMTTHLKTFYAGLFHKIDIKDLLIEGEFFPMAWDLAFMWPILEMAGSHSHFIPDILYVYNVATPHNDMKTNRSLQYKLALATCYKPRYHPVERPYD